MIIFATMMQKQKTTILSQKFNTIQKLKQHNMIRMEQVTYAQNTCAQVQ